MPSPSVPPPDTPWSCDDVRAHGGGDAGGPESLGAHRAVAEHVAGCAACRAERMHAAALVARLRRVDPAHDPASATLRRRLRALAAWTRRHPR